MYTRLFQPLTLSMLVDLAFEHSSTQLLSGWSADKRKASWVTLAIPLSLRDENSKGDKKTLESLSNVLVARTPIESDLNDNYPPFTTGVCCHFAYEFGETLEESLMLPPANEAVPVFSFMECNASVSTHLPSGKTYIYAITEADADLLEAFLLTQLSKIRIEVESPTAQYTLKSDVSQQVLQDQVEAIQQRILAGDFYQANLTRMLTVDLGDATRSQLSGFAERFLTQSQAPFGAVLNFENATVISASPERFFRIEPSPQGRKIIAEPIKGTRPRDQDPELDEALKQDLLHSEKDRAENIMIADLVRNDLSRICTDESIVADPVCELRSFATVHHLVTRVSGILKDEVSNLDALLAQFPCGSITGAPKWAAMEAIADLEQRGRGIYCGTIGYFDDRGHADFSVAIRTAVASFGESGKKLTYGTGGGITMLSDPQEEFTETEDKAAGFLRALQP